MTAPIAPIALTVHPGNGIPAGWRSQLIAKWLTANDIDPDDVSADHPITILTVPYRDTSIDGEGPWLIQVIVFTQYYRRPDGSREHHLLTHQPVAFQRTVPLTTPFPADPPTDGEDHGEADRQAAQETPEEVVRDAREEGVPDPRQGARACSSLEGEAARDEGAAEEGPGRGDQAVSEPEEDRRQEEVGGQ